MGGECDGRNHSSRGLTESPLSVLSRLKTRVGGTRGAKEGRMSHGEGYGSGQGLKTSEEDSDPGRLTRR